MPRIFLRDDSSTAENSSLSPIYIAGIALIGTIIMGTVAWLTVRQLRKRSRSKRENERGAAFLSVRGVVREGREKERPPKSTQYVKGTFSRNQLTQSVVLPEKALVLPPTSAPAANIIEYHQQSGNFPRPSMVSQPFSFALNASTEGLLPQSDNRGSWISLMSASGSGRSRFSVISSTSSVDPLPTTGTVRKIRQVFIPVLPDELLVVLGEKLNVIQSFDDGWCVVGKKGGNTPVQTRSLFKQAEMDNEVEIGLVPAWCFLKPVVGLKGDRPIRSSSLGITVQMEGPAFSSRDEIVSWSNF